MRRAESNPSGGGSDPATARADLIGPGHPLGSFDLRKPLHGVVFLTPLLFILLMAALWLSDEGDRPSFWVVAGQEGPLETVQAVCFFVAGVGAFAVGRRLRRLRHALLATAYFALAAMLVVIALEEISWGQRILGIETPEAIKSRNTQNELTLHNVEGIQELLHEVYLVVGFAAALAWLVVPNALLRKWNGLPAYVVPGAITTLYFLPVSLFYVFQHVQYYVVEPRADGYREFGFNYQEVFETPFAAGFVVFTLFNLRRLRGSTG